MKNIKYTLIAFSFLFSLHTAFAQADVKVEVQQQTNWCWAANSKCISNYYDKKTDEQQCDIVEWAYSNRKQCCQRKSSCNQMNNFGDGGGGQGPSRGMNSIIRTYVGLQASHYNGGLSISRLEKANEEKRPYIIGCMWSGQNGGHVVVGCAYSNNKVTVMDPWQNNGIYTFRYSGNGSSISLNGGSGNWKEGLEITEAPLSTDEKFKSGIKVYPTLAVNTLTVQLSETATATAVTIYNALGKTVASKNLVDATSKVEVSNLAAGVYFAKLTNGAKEATFKFIKQ